MLERNVTVTHLPVKNSFIYIPKKLTSLANGMCVKLTYGNEKTGYFSVSNSVSTLGDDSIGISSLYCKTLGIEENENVLLSEIPLLPTINSITVTPTSESDYDIIESLAENVQSTLLNQIRVVYSGQKFVIWIGNNLYGRVFVDNVKPVSPGILGFLTEVRINSSLEYVETPSILRNKITNIAKGFCEKINFFQNKLQDVKNDLDKFLNCKHDLVCRLVRIRNLPFFGKIGNHRKPFNIFLSKRNLSSICMQDDCANQSIFCSLSLITDDVFSNRTIYAQLFNLEDFIDKLDVGSENNIYVDDTVFNYFECDMGTRVLLKIINKPPHIKEINIHAKKNFLVDIEEEFKKFLSQHREDILVLNSDIPISIGNNVICSLKFSPTELKFAVIDSTVNHCKYTVVEEELLLPLKELEEEKSVVTFLEEISNYHEIIDCVAQIYGDDCEHFENVLIVGKPGTGKSSILKIISQKLEFYPHFIYTKTLNCRKFRGKTPDSLLRVLSETFSTLILHQPSLLMLDNLHNLCENVQGDETAPNSLYYNRISEMLHDFFKLFSGPNKIGICATTESIEKLNKHLYLSRGSHLFKNLFVIEELGKVDRLKLLRYLFKNHNTDEINFEELSMKTEGFVAHDIVDFYDKTLFVINKECETSANDADLLNIIQHHCDIALKNTCVLSLQNVNLRSPGEKDFSDVGGLEDVKDVLVKTLLWPAKYPNIFSHAPLRLQSGLLLYGPPGTGKTLLAATAAKSFGLRLISVKGPELLSKYIGASEQAVRDIFQKAQSVRPSILFFDEFDSLAPRRGHDNTGVTDRVVNQFLTQLDGVESLTGVCVLAATSRPDLLDPALLRPGRLDRQILCPLPDKNGRLTILTVLTKNLALGDDVNLETIAEATEWYSGADLQSLLYTAQISTIEGLLENDQVSAELTTSKVTQKHLEDALSTTKPSLTKQERFKYERIYAKFQSGFNMEDNKTGTRATLA